MKKVVFSSLFICLTMMIHAQDIKKAKSFLEGKQLEKAKTEIDAYVAKNPDDHQGYYYQSKIYEAIASDSSAQVRDLIKGDARQQVLDIFKKAMADTTDMKMAVVAMTDKYSPIFNLYTGYYEAAAGAFNNAALTGNKAGFEEAMNDFIKANNVGQFIASRGWARIAKVDTMLVLNTGKAALNAGRNDEALTYFSELADAQINGTKDGGAANSTFILPYQWLTLHYKDKKDVPNMMKYAKLGMELFPNDNYFDLVLIDYYREQKDYNALFNKYNGLVTKRPDSIIYHFNYANEIFGYLYNGDEGVVVQNKDSLQKVLGNQLELAYKINSNDVVTNWLYSQYYYNHGIDTRDSALKIKSTKPDEVKLKADLIAASKDDFNKAIPYADKALTQLEGAGFKKSDRSRYKSIVNLQQKIYQSLNQNDQVKAFQNKYDQADTKFVN